MEQPNDGDAEQEKGFIIGFGFSFENRELGIKCFGSPTELLEELARSGLDLATFEAHPATGIKARRIYKLFPELEFSGGADAEAILAVMEAFDVRNYDAANRILIHSRGLTESTEWAVGILLLSSVASGDIRAVQLLARAGIELGIQTHLGMTSLHWAAALGNAEIARVLLENGASSEVTSWFLVTPVELAIFNHHHKVERLFARKVGSTIESPSAGDILRRMNR